MPTPRAEGHARQISRSDIQDDHSLLSIPRACFMEIATSHRLKRTLVNTLCVSQGINRRIYLQKSMPSVHPWLELGLVQTVSWPGTSNTAD